jgi:hypothetical protein
MHKMSLYPLGERANKYTGKARVHMCGLMRTQNMRKNTYASRGKKNHNSANAHLEIASTQGQDALLFGFPESITIQLIWQPVVVWRRRLDGKVDAGVAEDQARIHAVEVVGHEHLSLHIALHFLSVCVFVCVCIFVYVPT